jgi:outer membrane protein TolC
MKLIKMICVTLYIVLLSGIFIPFTHVYADEAVTFTYEQALRMALNNNLDLQDLNTEIRNAHEAIRDEIWRMERQFFGSRPQIELTERAIENALQRLYGRLRNNNYNFSSEPVTPRQNREHRHYVRELIRHMEGLRLHRQQTELANEFILRNAVVTLTGIDLSINVLQREIDFMEVNLERLALAHSLGFIGTHELQTATYEFAQMLTGLDELLRNQTTARHELNYLLNQPFSQHTHVTFSYEIPSFADWNITAAIGQDPSIRLVQMELDRAMSERWVYTGNDRDIRITENERRTGMNITGANTSNNQTNLRNRIALQDAVERAVLGREQAIRTMEATLRRGFTDLEGLVAYEAALGIGLSQAQTILEMAIFNFDVGYTTRLDIYAAELLIYRIEQDIKMVINQKWILSFLLQNPSQ